MICTSPVRPVRRHAASASRAGVIPAALAGVLFSEGSDRVCLLAHDWDRVDAARVSADAAGMADRVSVHHASVLEFLADRR